MEVNKEIKSNSTEKRGKKKYKFDEFIMKVDVERFGLSNLLQNF